MRDAEYNDGERCMEGGLGKGRRKCYGSCAEVKTL